MALRKQLIPESPRRHSIACSLLDDVWFNQLKITDSVLFVAAGVFYYLEEGQLKSFLIKLADAFPGAEAFFDACSPRGLKVANKKVIQAGGMDDSAMLKWGLRQARDMESWDRRIEVVSEYPIFRNMKGGLSIGEKLGTMLSDVLRIMSMVHLRLRSRPSLAAK
jgi:O-methyltransferase involved in polyketide biosynthesis